MKDDIDITNIMDSNVEDYFDLSRCSGKIVTLSEDSKEVTIYIAGYVAKNLKERFGDSCNRLLTGDSEAYNPDFS